MKRAVTDAVLPASHVPVLENAAPLYLWLLVPLGTSGAAATLREASEAAHSAMDHDRDACAAGIFKAHPAHDWPYVRLVPDGGWTRNTHEWVAANVARQTPESPTPVTHGRHKIPAEQCAIVGANIRTLRLRKGWSQAKLGELMGWQSAATVCAAEGHRNNRQRRFRGDEIEQLAAIFGISPSELTTRCANCGGHPPAGFACQACGAPAS